MGNVLEKKAFWIILAIAFVLLIGGLIFGLVMTIKYGEPGEQKEEKQEKVVGVMPNNTFLQFCNDQNLYALDANLASNPITRISVIKNGNTTVITDPNEINAIWDGLKKIKIADASSIEVTPAEYTLTINRNTGSDALITFQSPTVFTFNGANYDISDSQGFFDRL
ncbi:MAG: hypothetical protein E7279_03590 [Lachnospiraceae bacterium]|nr:hypothetical protein [Lachnospiraceae bacterium]